MSFPRTEVVYQRRGGVEHVVTDPVKGAAIQPADWQATDDEVIYDVWIRTHLSTTSIHNSDKTAVTLRSAASGGTVSTFTGNGTNGDNGVQYRVHTFTGNGDFVLRFPRTVEHLIVAGGGGGGSRHGGGGGGGGVLSGSGSRTAATYPITVGAGGKGRDKSTDKVTAALNAANGGNSTAFGLTASGGGRGGSGDSRGGAASGGSGGGSEFSTGSSGTSGQGNAGGNGSSSTWSGGGGGGAGAAGGNSTPTGNVGGGAGGSGIASTITGSSVTYGGGGGGSMDYAQTGTAGRGGIGGGGAGGHLGWEIFDLRGILRWELYTLNSSSTPNDRAGFDSLISGATRTSVGYASIGTTNRTRADSASGTLLDWNGGAQLRAITGATLGAGDSADTFALVVTGRFWATHTDTYTFQVESDDSAEVQVGGDFMGFYGNRGLANGATSQTFNLTAGGPYTFRVRFREAGGGEALRVFWYRNGDTTRRQEGGQIGPGYPESAAEYDALLALASKTTSGSREISTQTGTTTANSLNWTDTNRGTVFSGVSFPNSGTDFAYVVRGTFVPSETGTYSFTVAGDDAVDVSVDGTVVAAHYGGHAISELGVAAQTGTISLQAGQAYRFRARHEEGDGGDGLRVFWRKPSQSGSSDWFQDAAELTAVARNGIDGMGGGGGAAGSADQGGMVNFDGGRGGNGVVIVRYPARVTPVS